MKILLIFLYPLLELYGLIVLGSYITGLGVITWVIVSGILGAWIIKAEGQQGLFTFQNQLKAGQLPEELIFNKLAIYLAGVLFLIPGVISDFFAIILLIPFTRQICIHRLSLWMRGRMQARGGQSGANTFFYYASKGPEEENTRVTYECQVNETESKDDDPLTIDCKEVPQDSKHSQKND